MQRIPQGLMPCHDNDRDKLKSIKLGKPVKVKLTQIRNYEFLRKYFALLNLAFDYWNNRSTFCINSLQYSLLKRKFARKSPVQLWNSLVRVLREIQLSLTEISTKYR